MKAKKTTCLYGRGKALFILVWLGWVSFGLVPKASAQVIDENLPADSIGRAVGTDSLDYVAQAFVADIRQVHTLGAWLRNESGNAGTKLRLTETANGRPNFNRVLHETALILPDSGRFYYDSSFINDYW